MRFCVLGSGSKGNCTYIASGKSAVLVDAGFSGIEVERRLHSVGVDITTISAIIVTHEHLDHVRGVAVLSRRFDLPVFANMGTKDAAGKYLENLSAFNSFSTGTSFTCDGLTIHPFAISHDSADPVGFTVSDGTATVGYCTDTGVVSKLIQYRLSGCQGLVLESNHDLGMLKNGPYPVSVQQRVRSKKGHLANPQAIDVLRDLYHDALESVVLAHISESNNCSEIIASSIETLQVEMTTSDAENGNTAHISIASQDTVGELIHLGARSIY